ncbi:uncharacterized protein LOC122264090 [Penaeus japonicus]|uniref:uncharacterized protein LOC122264090 n=1 Tax=Penaeus japonicus TaxID=27405 RepID=UPI001C712934|nr:uncharacterized protein LOC122264090 [Penaeus japonicus]
MACGRSTHLPHVRLPTTRRHGYECATGPKPDDEDYALPIDVERGVDLSNSSSRPPPECCSSAVPRHLSRETPSLQPPRGRLYEYVFLTSLALPRLLSSEEVSPPARHDSPPTCTWPCSRLAIRDMGLIFVAGFFCGLAVGLACAYILVDTIK